MNPERQKRMWEQANLEAQRAPVNQPYASPAWSKRLLDYRQKQAEQYVANHGYAPAGAGQPVLSSAIPLPPTTYI